MSSMNKISSVEGIRGLACLMVLISHLTLIFFLIFTDSKII